MTVQPNPPESPYTASFVIVTHEATGQTSLVANMPGVLDNMAARGWVPRDPESIEVAATPDTSGDGSEFITMYHPELKKFHDFPNNSDAVQGARDSGWIDPEDETSSDDKEDGTAETPEPIASANEEKE